MLGVPTLAQILGVIGLALLGATVLIATLSTVIARLRPASKGVIALIPTQRSNSHPTRALQYRSRP